MIWEFCTNHQENAKLIANDNWHERNDGYLSNANILNLILAGQESIFYAEKKTFSLKPPKSPWYSESSIAIWASSKQVQGDLF